MTDNPPTKDDLRTVVVNALHAATGVLNDPVRGRALLAGEDLSFAELDIDSLTMLEMLMEIEDQLGLEIDADEVAEHETLAALIYHLSRRTSGDAG